MPSSSINSNGCLTHRTDDVVIGRERGDAVCTPCDAVHSACTPWLPGWLGLYRLLYHHHRRGSKRPELSTAQRRSPAHRQMNYLAWLFVCRRWSTTSATQNVGNWCRRRTMQGSTPRESWQECRQSGLRRSARHRNATTLSGNCN